MLQLDEPGGGGSGAWVGGGGRVGDRGGGAGGASGAGDDRERLGRDAGEARVRRDHHLHRRPGDGGARVRQLLRLGGDDQLARCRTAGSERLGGGPQHRRLLGLVVTRHGGTGPGGELGAARCQHHHLPPAPGSALARPAAGQRARVRGRRRGVPLPAHLRRRRRVREVSVQRPHVLRDHALGRGHRQVHGGVQAPGQRVRAVPVSGRRLGRHHRPAARGDRRVRRGQQGADQLSRHRPVHDPGLQPGHLPDLGAESQLLGPRRVVPGSAVPASLRGRVQADLHRGQGHQAGGPALRPARRARPAELPPTSA